MAAQHPEGPGGNGAPIPRELPDQQASQGEDPWDIGGSEPSGEASEDVPEPADVPDTDESGTGRQGAPREDISQSDHPVPDEPSA
ncbi:hypothetical protein ACFWBB_19225 [Streptomyces sp. NPDC060000]|uniref:hypothetical protein n=1 Tax=Streptomyces sp. NPDC060000 TaxID=3347031 RepID=UPI0036746676